MWQWCLKYMKMWHGLFRMNPLLLCSYLLSFNHRRIKNDWRGKMELWLKKKKLQKNVQPSGAGRVTMYPLRKPESVIMSLADTFSISSLSRRLGARTFCGEWIQDLKRSLVGFRINNDTNRKRLKSSRLENHIKSSYPVWPPHSEGAFLWLWSARFWVAHLLCTHKIITARQRMMEGEIT